MRYKNCFDKERRDFLRIVERAGISAGVLKASSLVTGVMLARASEAQNATANKSCLIFSGGGCLTSEWYPQGGTFGQQSAPLQKHYSKIAMMNGATLSGVGHGVMFHRFDNASWSRDSFDVNMGRTIGSNYPVKYLNVGVTAVDQLSREGSRNIPTISSPQAALDILFAGGGGSSGGSSGGVSPRKSIVDLHYPAVNSLKTKLGQHEKDKLDQHFTAIEEIEASIASNNNGGGNSGGGNSGGSGGACPKPASGAAVGFDAMSKMQADIITLALSCNLTASVSIAFGDDSHNHFFDKLGRMSHDSHHYNKARYIEDINYMQTLSAYLIDKLEAAGLLNSTIVAQLSDMGFADAHGANDVPMFVLGGGIAGGRQIAMGGKDQASLWQAIGQKLRADQSPHGAAYRNWGVSPISI